MEISNEIRQAALALGEALHSTKAVQEYLDARARLLRDAQSTELELSLDALVSSLEARQRAGEQPSPEELDAFYALRSRVWGNPLITKRNATLGLLKPVFADVADDIRGALGLDFIQMTMATE